MSTTWFCRCGKAPASVLRIYWFKPPSNRPRDEHKLPTCWEVGVDCFECAIKRILDDVPERTQNFQVVVEGESKAAVVDLLMEQTAPPVQLRGKLPKTDVQKAVAWLKKAVRTDA